jgi:hypothetical protein
VFQNLTLPTAPAIVQFCEIGNTLREFSCTQLAITAVHASNIKKLNLQKNNAKDELLRRRDPTDPSQA